MCNLCPRFHLLPRFQLHSGALTREGREYRGALPRGEREYSDALTQEEEEKGGSTETEQAVGPNGRWRCYSYDDISKRDKASLDIFWLKDESLSDSENLPPPDVIAQEIMDDLEAALEQMREIATDLNRANKRQA